MRNPNRILESWRGVPGKVLVSYITRETLLPKQQLPIDGATFGSTNIPLRAANLAGVLLNDVINSASLQSPWSDAEWQTA